MMQRHQAGYYANDGLLYLLHAESAPAERVVDAWTTIYGPDPVPTAAPPAADDKQSTEGSGRSRTPRGPRPRCPADPNHARA